MKSNNQNIGMEAWSDGAKAGATRRSVLLGIIAGTTTTGLGLGWLLTGTSKRTPGTCPKAESIEPRAKMAEPPSEQELRAMRAKQRAQFYDHDVAPLLKECRVANAKAVEQTCGRFHEIFDGYRSKARPFAEDMNTWSTRWRTFRRMVKRMWHDDDPVQTFVENKFRKHFFTPEILQRDLTGAIEVFLQDVERNRMNMLGAIKAAVSRGQLTNTIRIPDWKDYCDKIIAFSSKGAAQTGINAVLRGAVIITSSEVASALATQLALRGLQGLLAGAAVEGGEVAAMTAGGAEAGSLAGPLGTAIGLVIGLIAGVVTDWWMSGRAIDNLEEQMKQYISQMENGILGNFAMPTRAAVRDLSRADYQATKNIIIKGI